MDSRFDNERNVQPAPPPGNASPVNDTDMRVSASSGNMQAQIDKLVLVNMALWSLLREKAGLTDEQLRQRIEQIDVADGQLDGRVQMQAKVCPQCQRVIGARHNRCLYCGCVPTSENAFDLFQTGPVATPDAK